jgi:protein ImuB
VRSAGVPARIEKADGDVRAPEQRFASTPTCGTQSNPKSQIRNPKSECFPRPDSQIKNPKARKHPENRPSRLGRKFTCETPSQRTSNPPHRYFSKTSAPYALIQNHNSTELVEAKSQIQNLKFEIPNPLPLVLIEQVATRQIVIAVCEQSFAAGVRMGMTLAQARALCPGLEHAIHEPTKDHRALEALGRWLTRFTPVVAIEAPGCLMLDLTGCERVFGGLEPLVRQIAEAVRRMGFAAKLAVAPTIGAAWAMTFANSLPRYSGGGLGRGLLANSVFGSEPPPQPSPGVPGEGVNPKYSLIKALSQIPVVALRLDAAAVGTLLHLGVETIGQLLALDRSSLLTRFGPQVLLRIDQALGNAPEMLRPLPFRLPIRSGMEFDGPIESLETIWEVLRRLVVEIVPQLEKIGSGARRIEAEFRRAYDTPVHKTVLLARPSRNRRNIVRLLLCAAEKLDGGDDGFSGITLAVPLHEPVSDEQLALDDGMDEQSTAVASDVARLMEVLSIRLGPQSVLKAQPQACHLPERAYQTAEGVAATLTEMPVVEIPKKKQRRRRISPSPGTPGEGWGGGSDQRRVSQGAPSLTLPRNTGGGNEHKPAFTALRIATEVLWEPEVPEMPADAEPDRTDFPHVPPPDRPEVCPPLSARPLRLLPTPRPLRVSAATLSQHGEEHRVLTLADDREVMCVKHVCGPERIDGLWWEGHNKTRDYYDVETTDGRRLWIFRVNQTGKWFAHGEFM